MDAIIRSWRYLPDASHRDLRLDLLRGYFIVVMTIDHIGFFPAWTQVFTGRGKLWVSAAEGFVIISGLMFGRLYRRRILEKGWDWSIHHLLRRAVLLYLVSVVGGLVFYTGDYLLQEIWGRPSTLPASYVDLIINAVLFVRSLPPRLDLLMLYVAFMPLGLFVIYLLKHDQVGWVLGISYFLWQARILDHSVLVFLQSAFNFASWQPLFVLGIIGGFYREELQIWWHGRPHFIRQLLVGLLLGGTAVILITSYQITIHHLFAGVSWLQSDSAIFYKPTLAPGRLIAALIVFTGLWLLVAWFWVPLRRMFGWLLLPLGQHSLTAYVVHAFPIYLVRRLPWTPTPFGPHNPIAIGFIHVLIVLLVWQATRLFVLWRDTKLPVNRNPKTVLR
ncbi:MAG: OpgC domain-containing protein [Anaerolineae bacterium]